MKRGLSGLEKLMVVVPVLGLLLAWRWDAVRNVWHQMFPITELPDASDLEQLHFSGDGRLLATNETILANIDPAGATNDTFFTVRVREMTSGVLKWQQREKSRNGMQPFMAQGFSADGKLLLQVRKSSLLRGAATSNGTVYICDAATGRVKKQFDWRDLRNALFVDGGRKILCEGDPTLIYDSQTMNTLAVTESTLLRGGDQTISANGRMALMVSDSTHSQNGRDAELWDFSGPTLVATLAQSKDRPVGPAAISVNGKFACIGFTGDSYATVWRLQPRRKVGSIAIKNIASACFSPDARYLMVRSEKRTRIKGTQTAYTVEAHVALFDTALHRLWSHAPKPHPNSNRIGPDEVLFSADSRYAVTVGSDGIRWLNVRTGRAAHWREGRGVRFSPDRKTMVISSERGLEIQPVPTLPTGPPQ